MSEYLFIICCNSLNAISFVELSLSFPSCFWKFILILLYSSFFDITSPNASIRWRAFLGEEESLANLGLSRMLTISNLTLIYPQAFVSVPELILQSYSCRCFLPSENQVINWLMEENSNSIFIKEGYY